MALFRCAALFVGYMAFREHGWYAGRETNEATRSVLAVADNLNAGLAGC